MVEEQVPTALKDLGEVIRALERETGQPAQFVVKVGNDNFLVGDLSTRRGEYRLEMVDEYSCSLPHFQNDEYPRRIKNPHKHLVGTYTSFDQLQKAIVAAKPIRTKLKPVDTFDEFFNSPHLLGSCYNGYSVGIPGQNLGSAGGQCYDYIGRVIPPLLQEGEQVPIIKIK